MTAARKNSRKVEHTWPTVGGISCTETKWFALAFVSMMNRSNCHVCTRALHKFQTYLPITFNFRMRLVVLSIDWESIEIQVVIHQWSAELNSCRTTVADWQNMARIRWQFLMCSSGCANFNVAYKLATIAASRSSVTYDHYIIHCAIAVSGYTAVISPTAESISSQIHMFLVTKLRGKLVSFQGLKRTHMWVQLWSGAVGIFDHLFFHALLIKEFEKTLPRS